MKSKLINWKTAFPAIKDCIFLNSGSASLMPLISQKAMIEAITNLATTGPRGKSYFGAIATTRSACRSLLSQIVQCSEAEMVLTSGTSEGINIIVNGLDWSGGGDILVSSGEHLGALAGVYALQSLPGIKVQFVSTANNIVEQIVSAITNKTKLVILSHVMWQTGNSLSNEEINYIGAICEKKGIFFILDGAQSVGAINVNVNLLRISAYAFSGQKWLCGPGGTGGLYIKYGALSSIGKRFASFHSFSNADEIGNFEFYTDGRQYEFGGESLILSVGLRSSLEWWIHKVKPDWAFHRINELKSYCLKKISTLSTVSVITSPESTSGICTFEFRTRMKAELNLVDYLEMRKVIIRSVHSPNQFRVSTSFYNSFEDIDTLISILVELERQT